MRSPSRDRRIDLCTVLDVVTIVVVVFAVPLLIYLLGGDA